ncbi:hypothetical protein Ae168Ps1_3998 [Pseudonocardia sp. Ae168_Ps1]|nr:MULTISPECIES: FxLD family lanthipeptide [unclassified Pseudonocardia]OLL75596.1 hypothetical protein Ae150APs1_3974 [Pseudonocardia sp. Ae150A_Ps1]OLL81592.1 hypothetical protein Ae168Ps1_3998 [Pseudonocardia sp. Ae168_Ps1]OLL84295.1 hypothetical protein Ae263Ps1_1350c [Pseudonocardia sp. Ae263_Ps1]OLL95686.1 hypothetical protein Ae356Ps1_5583 [Pseudonocardia sp. Ae356_Ps1]
MGGDPQSCSGPLSGNEFDLDMRLVEFGPVASVLLGNTDDGCDTDRNGDC